VGVLLFSPSFLKQRDEENEGVLGLSTERSAYGHNQGSGQQDLVLGFGLNRSYYSGMRLQSFQTLDYRQCRNGEQQQRQQ